MKKLKNKYTFLVYLGTFLLGLYPSLLRAQFNSSDVKTLTRSIIHFLNSKVITFLVLLALANFIYSVLIFIKSEENDKNENKQRLIWGIIALFVIMSIWGIIFTLSNTFGITVGGSLEGWSID